MEPTGPSPKEIDGSQDLHNNLDLEAPVETDLSHINEQQDKKNGLVVEDTPSADVQNGAPAFTHLDEIRLMKLKIEELERQTMEGQPPNNASDSSEYQRLEKCLFKHRRDWEMETGPGIWTMGANYRYSLMEKPDYPMGPWLYNWNIHSNNKYKRPDPFDTTHECGGNGDHDDNLEFKKVIDFESRRQRIRKNFEWEMDRLYLKEEIEDRRKAQEVKAQEEIARKQAQDKGSEQFNGVKNGDRAKMTEPRIKRMDWPAFKRASTGKIESTVVDILMGEPILQDTALSGYGLWLGLTGSSSQKSKTGKGSIFVSAKSPEEAPLPERVRIHSDILLKILDKILHAKGENFERLPGKPMVFIRPFKALLYCEGDLRGWCSELEKKFTVSSSTPVEVSANPDAGSNEPSEASESTSAVKPPHQEDNNANDESVPALGIEDEEEDEDEDNDPHDQNKNEDTTSLTALKHLRCLLEFLDADIGTKERYIDEKENLKVFFSDLWHVFRPGMEVIGRDGKQAYKVVYVKSARHRVLAPWQRFEESTDGEGKKTPPPFSVTCVYIDFDGKSLGPVAKHFDFKRFEGRRDITSMDVYPLRLYPQKNMLSRGFKTAQTDTLTQSERSHRYRQELIERGRKFLTVAGVKHMFYAGPTLEVRDEVESQVVIDFETAFAVEDKEQQEWKPNLEFLLGSSNFEDDDDEKLRCQSSCCQGDQVYDDSSLDWNQTTDYINGLLSKPDGDDGKPPLTVVPSQLKDLRAGSGNALTVTEDDLVIMSYRVFGFVLRTRKWAKLDLSYLTDVHPPEAQAGDGEDTIQHAKRNQGQNTTFERLVMDEKHKGMIISLISQHFRDKGSATSQQEQVDIVRGKGKGLILLLHGAPGVGKTSTAEGVAGQFKKPLFQITCGDLGTTAKEVEKALETTFSLANRWDCILLLDEADVFLSQRTKEDFQRNGLVAVFLRVMEYYAGVLFLTTNRVGDFDEAFTSRIHVSLYYPELDSDKTASVFMLNLDLIKERFRHKKRQVKIDKVRIGIFASRHYIEHPDARWNGRQIRNACHTALALAEFEAQGGDSTAIENPDATVVLSVEHFETVRDAYIEFTKYINKLHGNNASRRAQESKLRAIWIDESDNVVATHGFDQKARFARAAQHTPPVNHHHAPPATQVSSHQPLSPDFQDMSRYRVQLQHQHQQQQYYGHQDMASRPAGYPHPNQMPPQEQQPLNAWNQSDHNASLGVPGSRQEQYQRQPSPQQLSRPSPPAGSNFLPQSIEAMYADENPRGPTHDISHTFT